MQKKWYSCCYTDRYLQVVPWGFRKVLKYIGKEYNNPTVMLIENGLSDYGELNDRNGVDYHIVSGYFAGSLLMAV
jgi:beta-glucosidase/6-phospho-beta-glucosidase/beta-galactosidase